MKFGFTVKGYRAEIAVTVLTKKAIFSLLVQALELPAIVGISVTALTFNVSIGITKQEA